MILVRSAARSPLDFARPCEHKPPAIDNLVYLRLLPTSFGLDIN